MSYQTASPDDVESMLDDEQGGLWFLKEPLDTESLGVSLLELEPGASGMKHDHVEDDIEEVYVVVDGTVDIELDGETERLGADEAIRLPADQTRQVHNASDERARLVLMSAPE